mmetsp:Transcript_12503/g.12263  ORF Transcript_12503/g.12263 Transcript_12503/m.12263 type:complete len:304 (+) Transcript_12503:469-1380(+)
MSFQTSYRDAISVSELRRIDAACMLVPWLWSIGFAITFSALFAKIWRVKKLVDSSIAMKRIVVTVMDVVYILVVVLSIETVVLLLFQFLSPLKWERTVMIEIEGYPIRSAGMCRSTYDVVFWPILVVEKVIFLVCALYLCNQTRHINNALAERDDLFWVVMMLFQILLLVVPLYAMVREQPEVLYFVMVSAVFLQNVTALVIIFTKKNYRTVVKSDKGKTNLSASIKESIQAPGKSKSRAPQSIAARHYTDSHESRLFTKGDIELENKTEGADIECVTTSGLGVCYQPQPPETQIMFSDGNSR